VDVTHKLGQVAIRLAENRLVAALKNVADLLVLAIVILAVAGQHSLHYAADWSVLHLDQQMYVIGHQAIGVKVEGEFRFLLCKKVNEPQMIIVGAEYLTAIIPASDDVIEPSAYFDSWSPGHGS